MRRVPIFTILTAGLLVALFLVYAFRFQVRFNEVAVRIRSGAATEVVRDPGVYFRWPPPIERVETFDARLKTTDLPESETKTLDGKNIIVGLFALWKIEDPQKFSVRAVSEREAEDKMRARINQARAAAIGQMALNSFVGLDREQVNQNFDNLLKTIADEAAPGLLNDFGIKLVSVGVRRLSLPEQVTQEVFNSMKAQREAIAAAYRQEGLSRQAAITARAEAAARSILAFAESKAKQIEAEGQRAAARIINEIPPEYREFYIWLRRMEALKASLQERSTIFLDAATDLMGDFVRPPDVNRRLPQAADLQPPAARPEPGAADAAAPTSGDE